MSIAITGANGKLGQLIMEELLLFHNIPPHHIIACVRDLQSAEMFTDKGVTVRHCDYDQPHTLKEAFVGASKLLLISSSHPDDTTRLRQHAHVIEAAKQVQVKQLLYTSFAYPEHASTAPAWLHLATEHAIRTTGIPFTFLRSALYTDFVEVLNLHAALNNGYIEIAPGNWKFNSVIRPDLAAAIAAALTLSGPGDGHQDKIYELTSPAVWTFEDLATALSSFAGKTITVHQDSQIQHWIYKFISRIDTTSTSGDLEQLMGRSATSLEDSIKPFLKANG